MIDPTMQRLYDSARQSGISDMSNISIYCQNCGMSVAPLVSMAPCDIQSLHLTMAIGTDVKQIVIDARRRGHAIGPMPDSYRSALSTHDLVVEALTTMRNDKTTAEFTPLVGISTLSPRQMVGDPKTEAGEDKPLAVTAWSIPSAVCGSNHLETSIEGGKVDESATGGETVKADVHTKTLGYAAESYWGRLWPFGEDRTEIYEIEGDSCGLLPSGKPLKNLKIQMVAIPQEGWRLTIGLDAAKSGSKSTETKYYGGDPDKKKGSITHKEVSQSGNTTTASTDYHNSSADRKSGVVSHSKDSTKEGKTGLIFTDSNTYSDDDYQNFGITTQKEARKVKIEKLYGSRSQAADIDKVVNQILAIADIVEDLGKLFEHMPQVGLKVGYSFSFFSGSLVLEWGNRWPESYPEDNRVHYIERYITIEGECMLIEGAVKGSFGVDIDLWVIDTQFEAVIGLELKASVSIGANQTVSRTNPARIDFTGDAFKVDTKAAITPELEAKVKARVMGWEVSAGIALEADLTFDAKLELAFETAPSLKATLASKGVRLVGSATRVGASTKSYEFKPWVIIEKKEWFKDKELF